jgi:serine/threonine-protein kinase
MAEPGADRDIVEEMASEFAERLRRGEAADVEEYAARCPERSEEIHALFPTIAMMEQAKFKRGRAVSGTPPELTDHPRYRILARLGEGGMGTVYKAEHRLMERIVALKVMGGHLVSHPQTVERFRQEVRAAGRLSHPNIVVFHDAEQAGNLHFLVMEYVDGISLARLLERKTPLSIADACSFARQTALGLQHAHERGMVHRDIKPGNLMVTRQGQIKILDFGLARLFQLSGDVPDNMQKPARPLTSAGTLMGTPDFLAPEQATDSSKVDARADLYSLGCTLYYLLSGKVPFPGETYLAKVYSHSAKEAVPIEQLRPEVPVELGNVVRKLMAKAPGERFQTAAETAAVLSPFARQTPSAEVLEAPESVVYTHVKAGAVTQRGDDTSRNEDSGGGGTLRLESKEEKPTPSATGSRKLLLLAGGAALLGVCLIVLALIRGGKKEIDPPDVRTEPKDKPVVLIVAERGFAPFEYQRIREGFSARGCKIVVASTRRGQAMPMRPRRPDERPVPVPIDSLVSEIRVQDIAALVFCGGPGAVDQMINPDVQKQMQKLVNEALAEKKPMAAISFGIVVLADTGALKERKLAAPFHLPRIMDRLRSSGAILQESPVVEDGPIITCRGERDIDEFLKVLLAAVRR